MVCWGNEQVGVLEPEGEKVSQAGVGWGEVGVGGGLGWSAREFFLHHTQSANPRTQETLLDPDIPKCCPRVIAL